jgi:Fe-S-cluster-containing dehydrogenase component
MTEKAKWGLVIDMDRCNGCSACITACAMENNVPYVGESDAGYGRSMQWIRIERYWEGEYPNITVHFMPILCQQCGAAPCEPVCPVFATVHSMAEEVNLQVYNRCVGTRYCANNCPYIVRQFNWFDYAQDMPEPLNYQFNPDVTVRRRGVMEKCTFCIQRIRRAEERAKVEGREVQDGEFETACAVACPSDAIVFGLLSDPNSEVSHLARSARSQRLLLEELGTDPRVIYLKAERGSRR